MTASYDSATRLRFAFRGNALFSGLSGLLMVVTAQPMAFSLGVDPPWALAVLGAGLILYALWLLQSSRRSPIDPRDVWAAVALDSAWVLGSGLIPRTSLVTLTGAGKWVVGLVAALVSGFAVLQIVALQRGLEKGGAS
jgi:hypothetical protein